MEILGIDSAWANIDPKAIKAAGYSFRVRYLSFDPTKNLTPQERDADFEAGLGILLVWEAGAQDALGGTPQGQREGAAAAQQAEALGYPQQYPLFFATDFNEPANDFPVNADYLRAAQSEGPFQPGPYGSIALCNYMIQNAVTHYAWQTSAWSGTAVDNQANLYQRQSPTKTIQGAAAGSYDENVLIVPLPIWTAGAPATPPQPAPQPTPQPSPNIPPAKRNIFTPIAVDGAFGLHSIKAEQFVSYNGNQADCDGVFGLGSKKSMQGHLGVKQDGVIGPVTIKVLQRRVGAAQDGQWGTLTTEALQRALNQGTY